LVRQIDFLVKNKDITHLVYFDNDFASLQAFELIADQFPQLNIIYVSIETDSLYGILQKTIFRNQIIHIAGALLNQIGLIVR